MVLAKFLGGTPGGRMCGVNVHCYDLSMQENNGGSGHAASRHATATVHVRAC